MPLISHVISLSAVGQSASKPINPARQDTFIKPSLFQAFPAQTPKALVKMTRQPILANLPEFSFSSLRNLLLMF